ncbi:MAG: hypothetical protein ACOYW3_08115 [Bacteroidota bacterium]
MTPFEYVSVLISIVLGLGITQIVTGVADLIHHWVRVKFFWPHLLIVFLVFFLHLQEWWLLYSLKDHGEWRLSIFLFTILYPIFLFIMARILFPSDFTSPMLDLRDFYFANYRKFFLIISILALLSIIDNVFIQQRAWGGQLFQIVLLVSMIVISARKFESITLHKVVAILLLIAMLGGFVYNWNEWVLK